MFIFKAVLFVVVCLSWSSCKQTNYCSICKDHTLCKYNGIGKACVDVGQGGVSEEEKKEIVDLHNWARNLVAGGFQKVGNRTLPKAANMRKLKWDNELGKSAQAWADQCTFRHDTCRNDKRWKVGQNLYWKMKYPNHKVNWTEAIMSWYDEVSLYDPKDTNSYKFNSQVGHYTQMIWHDTYSIGCGRRDYGSNKLYVCNYGPAGNWIDEPIYEEGEPCSKCPQGTSCKEYLCAIDGKIKGKAGKPRSGEEGGEQIQGTTETACDIPQKQLESLQLAQQGALIMEEIRNGLLNITNDLENIVIHAFKRFENKE